MSKGTVLIADDDTAIRTVLAQALGRAGFDEGYGHSIVIVEMGEQWRG